MKHRLVVGELGNELGHIYPTQAKTHRGAQIALGRKLAPYGKDGWGRTECATPSGTWARCTEWCTGKEEE